MYDLMESMAERGSFSRWRRMVWGRVRGPRVLETTVRVDDLALGGTVKLIEATP